MVKNNRYQLDSHNEIKLLNDTKSFKQVIASISKTFVNILSKEDFDNAINGALLEIRLFFNADRAYIFEFSEDLTTVNYTYESCSNGISSQMKDFIDIPTDSMPWWFDKIKNTDNIHIPDINLLPEEADAEKSLLLSQKIKSLIVFPIKKLNNLIGFYGIDEVRQQKTWKDEEITLLQILADILAWAYDKKQIELKLQQIEQQKALQQNFVSIVSHEFKTPLSIIDSSAQRILRNIETMETSEVINRMGRIRNSVSRLNNLVETTLNLAKLETGKFLINPSMNDIKDIVLSAISEIKYIASDRKIIFHCSGNTITEFDPHKIYLVINNLLSNAIKYSEDEINVYCEEQDEYIKVAVVDKGFGLSKEDLEQIGNKFFRSKKTETISGTGIGIYFVKSIIEMHDGKLEIKSELGLGSTFAVYLLKDKLFY